MTKIITFFLGFLLFFGLTRAQETPVQDSTSDEPVLREDLPTPPSSEITNDSTIESNLTADPPRNFSLVFMRTLMTGGTTVDTVPISGTSSGTFSIGAGFKVFLFRDRLGLRITPAVSWTYINYEVTEAKTFPTTFDSTLQLEQERHVLSYAELSASAFYTLSKDEDGDPKFFIEGGGYGSYMLAGSYRTRFTDVNGLRNKQKIRDLATVPNEFMRLRYGVFGRFGYKWAAFTLTYRLSEVFDEFTNDIFLPKPVEGYRNPIIPPLELGVSIFF